MVLVSKLNLRGCRCGQCYCKRPPFIGPSTFKPKNSSGYTPPPPPECRPPSCLYWNEFNFLRRFEVQKRKKYFDQHRYVAFYFEIKLLWIFQTFNLVLHTMAGSDACPVWLNRVVIGALPVTASRHNSPAHPYFLYKLVCSNLPCGDACIVVRHSDMILTHFIN